MMKRITERIIRKSERNRRFEEKLLRTLKAEDRFVLLLMYGEGWSTEEIADRLGWSRANVKVRAHRARQKLRRLLEGETR